jgi:succinate-semialdehyde dehydrogenase/glutarate-semialdehyde dehydrogenase
MEASVAVGNSLSVSPVAGFTTWYLLMLAFLSKWWRDVTPDMRAFREELFGPAAVVYCVANADETVALANHTPYGLGASVYTLDEARALDMADRIDTGMVWINTPEGGGAELPFGGTKRSGVGRDLGPYGLEEFVNKKLMHTPRKSTY